MKVFLNFVPKREQHIAGPERVVCACRKERRACFTQITRRHTAVLFSIYAPYWAEMQVAIAVAEPLGCLLLADVAGDCGLAGWTPEPHLLGTTGCGPLCTGRG
jgi:hypothetical protein